MSYVVYDYRCESCDRIEERFVRRSEADEQSCECGNSMRRLASVGHLDWDSLSSPEAISRFDRVHRQKKALEDKSYREHGDYGGAWDSAK